MPTQWRYINESVLRFGRSFGGCNRRSNQLCVLDDLCHGNETIGKDIASCCQRNETIFDDWSSHTWYYFHMRGVGSVSKFVLDFKSNAQSVRNPQCGDVIIPPFGTVPFHNDDRLQQRILQNDVLIDTFRIDGTELLLFYLIMPPPVVGGGIKR